MGKPPFQFGLKAVFIATAGIAAVLTPVIYLSPFDFVIAAATVVIVFLPYAGFYLILCMLVYLCIWLIERWAPSRRLAVRSASAREVHPMTRIATRRRWLQFSLRGFIVILTIGCVLLGRKVERARTQQDAIKRIEAIGGFVHYAWQQEIRVMTINGRPTVPEETQPGPSWLRELIGDDFFQDVEGIYFVDHTDTASEQRILGLIEVFKRMPGLRFIEFWEWPQQETQSELEEALPDCEIRTSYPRPIQRNQDGTRMWLL